MKPKIPLPDLAQLHARPFMNRSKSRLQAKAGGGTTQIDLYGDIGFFGVTASDFRHTLNQIDGDIRLRINSPGGDVFDGIAIYNDLVDHPGKIQVEIPGLAASAASIIAMAGDSIEIAESAFLMIHNAWGLAIGNRHDMASLADLLASIDKSLAGIYVARTGIGIRAITQMMDDETWLVGKDAVEQGFADRRLATEDKAAARSSWDLSAFKHAPEALRQMPADQDTEWTIRDTERALRDAGCSQTRAKELAAKAFARGGHRDDDPNPDPTRRDVDPAMAQAVRELCAAEQLTAT